MAAAFTTDQTNWLIGFWSYFQANPRPQRVGPKQDGWDAAALVAGRGGYG